MGPKTSQLKNTLLFTKYAMSLIVFKITKLRNSSSTDPFVWIEMIEFCKSYFLNQNREDINKESVVLIFKDFIKTHQI